MQLSTPVAFFIFNRPETTVKVFEEIRRARPQKLLVVADGPREDRSGEPEKCAAARAVIDGVDWPCEVLRNFSDSNQGCKKRVSSGLDWVFDNVEDAIILEDDCLPHPTFFRFCQELLDRYRDDRRIMLISGYNIVPHNPAEKGSYFFTKYPHIWGWASWRRSWRHYDVSMKRWPSVRDTGRFRDFCGVWNEWPFWKDWFNAVYDGRVNTWDAQLTFTLFCQNGLVAMPKVNLIRNIGFGMDATHATAVDKKHSNVKLAAIDFPLEHPEIVVRDVGYDNTVKNREYSYRILKLAKKMIFG